MDPLAEINFRKWFEGGCSPVWLTKGGGRTTALTFLGTYLKSSEPLPWDIPKLWEHRFGARLDPATYQNAALEFFNCLRSQCNQSGLFTEPI